MKPTMHACHPLGSIWLRCVCALLLLVAFPRCSGAQAAEKLNLEGNASDAALAMLKEVSQRYEHAVTFRIESVEEWESKGEFNYTWNKTRTTAIFARSNRYHFEIHTLGTWMLQVSDGKTEWVYNPNSQEYTKKIVSSSGPSVFKPPLYGGRYLLNKTHDTPRELSHIIPLVDSASFLPHQAIAVNGSWIDCTVITVKGARQRGMPPDAIVGYTLWIDKSTGLIRRIHKHEEGTLDPSEPHEYLASDQMTTYLVAELDPPVLPDDLFAFTPPSSAKLVEKLNDGPINARANNSDIIGKLLPQIEFHGADGQLVSLRSLQGKPVLLDFWATWCGPCLDSMPMLEKLYREAHDRGLILFSVDEDEDPKRASDYFAEHKEPWLNFHEDDKIANAFPHQSIPYFVLIDESGRVVLAGSGFDESDLREALARLGSRFEPLAPATKP